MESGYLQLMMTSYVLICLLKIKNYYQTLPI